MIDLLSVIQQKTQGNLEPDEVQLIEPGSTSCA